MCLISVCPKGTEKNSEKVISFIKQGASSNTNGSGFMYKRNGENVININKGFFQVDEMIKALQALNLTIDDELVLHHRISTAGRISIENSHPFVISPIHEIVSNPKITTNLPCMVHNGHFGGIDLFMKLNPDFSDTYAFARYVLGNPHVWEEVQKDDKLLETLVGYSRVCILYPDKDLRLVGNFVTDDGYFHSNGGYKSYVFDRGGSSWGESKGRTVHTGGKGKKVSEKQGKLFEQDSELSCCVSSSTRLGDVLPKNQIGFKIEIGTKKPNHLLLTDDDVTINEYNHKNFYYIKKSTYDEYSSKNGLILRTLSDFDEEAIINYFTYKTSDGKQYTEAFLKNDLKDKYYYIPKGNYYTTVYKDFKKLKKLIIDNINNKQYHTSATAQRRILLNLLTTKENLLKSSIEEIYIPSLNAFFVKQAIQETMNFLFDDDKLYKKDDDKSQLNILSKILD